MRLRRWILAAGVLWCCGLAGAQVRGGGWGLTPLTEEHLAEIGAPAAMVRAGQIVLLAEDGAGGLRLAASGDGVSFRPLADAVTVRLGEDAPRAEGFAHPRLVEAEDGSYVLTYTARLAGRATLMVATSPDLAHWTVEGAAFAGAAGGRYESVPTGEGAILTRLDVGKNRLVAAMIDDKYWMYWGEGTVHVASSQDLVHWTPLADGTGGPVTVLEPRAGRFDSAGVEVGPPPVLTPAGVVVLYRGRNAPGKRGGDKRLPAEAWAVGEALFAPENPVRVAERSLDAVIAPAQGSENKEKTANGLVWFAGRWRLF